MAQVGTKVLRAAYPVRLPLLVQARPKDQLFGVPVTLDSGTESTCFVGIDKVSSST